MSRGISLIIVLLFVSSAQAAGESNLGRFLKRCAWGTGIGAAVGAVSLITEDKPSDHTVNIARGASLGLYGGIGYGVWEISEENARLRRSQEFVSGQVVPLYSAGGKVDGLAATVVFVP